MNKIFAFLLIALLAGCQNTTNYEYIDGYYDGMDEYDVCAGAPDGACIYAAPNNASQYSNVKYTMTDDNGLVLETKNHVVHVAGQPNRKYVYYVWAGDKTTADDPDLIVEDGVAAVLVQ